MYKLSNPKNLNYQAKVVSLPAPIKHPNADKLQIFSVDFLNVITDLSYNEGDTVVLFPVGCVINNDLIKFINGFQDTTKNTNPEVKGFFCNKGRVRALRLRGEKCGGFVLKTSVLEDFFKNPNMEWEVGAEFDTLFATLICEKYVTPTRPTSDGNSKDKKVVTKVSRLVENQVRLHVDTANFRRNSFKIYPDDFIGLHYKKHGASWWVGNLLVKRQPTWMDKIASLFGVKIQDTEYDYIYGSRRVVKNEFNPEGKLHYYKEDIWGEIKEKIKEHIPKGFTLYGEIIGYTSSGAAIQKSYDYGCEPNTNSIYVYRITFTNPDGEVFELDDNQIKDFCNRAGLLYEKTFYYYGRAKDLYPEILVGQSWNEEFIKRLELDYLERDCHMCVNKVPAEGLIIRRHSLFDYEAYKLKSFAFLEFEDKQLDSQEQNIEDATDNNS